MSATSHLGSRDRARAASAAARVSTPARAPSSAEPSSTASRERDSTTTFSNTLSSREITSPLNPSTIHDNFKYVQLLREERLLGNVGAASRETRTNSTLHVVRSQFVPVRASLSRSLGMAAVRRCTGYG